MNAYKMVDIYNVREKNIPIDSIIYTMYKEVI